jgi:hypothetical protein
MTSNLTSAAITAAITSANKLASAGLILNNNQAAKISQSSSFSSSSSPPNQQQQICILSSENAASSGGKEGVAKFCLSHTSSTNSDEATSSNNIAHQIGTNLAELTVCWHKMDINTEECSKCGKPFYDG